MTAAARAFAASGEGGTTMAKANRGGWKTCPRGHKYRGPDPCPICWPGGKKTAAKRALKPSVSDRRSQLAGDWL
jgi:hypothetical protein